MSYDITAEDILHAIQRRQQRTGPGTEFVIAPRELTSRPREQLKNTIIEEQNNSSRQESEDETGVQSPLRKTPPSGRGQEDFGSVITPASSSSRYSCVLVQHCITGKGVKLAITLQRQAADQTQTARVTAELKRYDRLREVKSRLDDSAQFSVFLEETKRTIYDLKQHEFCMGRMHQRGKRSQWLCDTLAVAQLTPAGQVGQVILNIDHEEYEVRLDGALTQAQRRLYHATGQWGDWRSNRATAPTMNDLEWETL
jgi:hypothetical protein